MEPFETAVLSAICRSIFATYTATDVVAIRTPLFVSLVASIVHPFYKTIRPALKTTVMVAYFTAVFETHRSAVISTFHAAVSATLLRSDHETVDSTFSLPNCTADGLAVDWAFSSAEMWTDDSARDATYSRSAFQAE